MGHLKSIHGDAFFDVLKASYFHKEFDEEKPLFYNKHNSSEYVFIYITIAASKKIQ